MEREKGRPGFSCSTAQDPCRRGSHIVLEDDVVLVGVVPLLDADLVGPGPRLGPTSFLRSPMVVIPLHQLKAVNSSSSRANPAEKYIQVISIDNHEFWYMGFLNYEGAVKSLEEVLQARILQSV
ncbi:hypothetical protein RJ640_010411 [Escallonia rubra]|uniref:GRAM domain-containing protein n=1 Tax=Escallonia rubra TaxID=112253 RepID=A0AA88R0J5_9ASTE|nr:hypothetical protein RJ640_010411 [Escallonia rubra]